jgi:hypothetical protein
MLQKLKLKPLLTLRNCHMVDMIVGDYRRVGANGTIP